MKRNDILGLDEETTLNLLYTLSPEELLWVELPSGQTYRVNAINTYHVLLKGNLVEEIITAVYIGEQLISPTSSHPLISCEAVISDDTLLFEIERGKLLREKDLLEAIHRL